jgi:hypothetical protein
MSEANRRNTTPTTRRDLAAGGFAMLVLAAAAAGTDKAQELDGELLGLCAEFKAQEDELNRIGDVLADMPWPGRDAHPLAQKERDGVARIHELRGLISDLPARTPEGIRAKAQAALIEFSPEDEWPVDNSYWIVWSLARDVLGKDL